MKKGYALLALFSLAMCVLFASFVLPNPFKYYRISGYHVSGVNFDSNTRPVDFYEKIQSGSGPLERLDLSLEFFVYRIGTYDNILQTGPLNSGVRIELAKPGTIALIVGSSKPPGYLPFVLTSSLSLEQWHRLRVLLEKSGDVKVWLDGNLVTSAVGQPLLYDMSDVVFGAGFDKQRRFHGKIRNGAVSTGFYGSNGNADQIMSNIRIFSFLTSLLLLYLLGDQEDRKAGVTQDA